MSSSLVITLDDDVIDKPLEPVSNYILVKMFAAISRTAGGIVLPDEVLVLLYVILIEIMEQHELAIQDVVAKLVQEPEKNALISVLLLVLILILMLIVLP